MKPAKETQQKWARFRQVLARQPKIFWAVCIIIVGIIAGGIIAYFVLSQKPATKTKIQPAVKTTKKAKPKPAAKYYSPLTGLQIADKATTKQPVTGIMIENSPDARPQSGLKNSGVVFEAVAEGGITRFMVLYQQEKPQLIGPVRSLRIYYLDWATAFNASIAHVGGSDEALSEVRNGNYRDIDQFFNSGSYWRATDRYAPHNVYTSFEKLDALNTSKGYTTSVFTGFTRVDGKPVDTPDATSINITISGALYNSSYIYDKTTNTYARSQAGAPHLDREAGQITPNVIIAMHVDEYTTSDYGHHESISTIGTGAATIFQNGTAINATWSKNSRSDQIKFTDAAGVEIPLVRGQTWITAISNTNGDVTWN